MAIPPTYVSHYGVAGSTTNATKTTASFNATAGDVLILFVYGEHSGSSAKPGAVSNTQGALTWTPQAEYSAANNTNVPYIKMYSAVVDANKTGMTVSVADNSGTMYWGIDVVHYTDTLGVGAANVSNNGTGSGAASVSLTHSGDNSATVIGVNDWNASSGARTYLTVNSLSHTERYYNTNASFCTVLTATHSDSGSAGAHTMGLSAPSGMRYGIGAIEVLGTTLQTISCNVLNTSATLFNPTVSLAATSQTVTCNLLTTSTTLFSPSVNQDINTSLIVTSTTIFSPALDFNVVFNVITTSTSLLNPTINPGAVSVVTPLIVTTELVLDPGSEMILQLSVVNTTSTLFSPALDFNINLAVLSTSSTVLQPLLVTKAETPLLATTSTVFSPGLNQDVNIPVLSTPASVLTPNVPAAGAQTIDYQVITTSSTLFSPQVFQTIAVPVINIPGTVESPSLKFEIGLQVINTSSTLFTPSLDYLIEMQTINTAPNILLPRIGEAPPDTGQYGIVKTNSPSPFPIGI